jgi:IclR family transcriptional regulator, KDG regulon repressor
MESTQLVKLFGLLETLAGHADGLPLAELAAEVGLAKPTAHRILKSLVALGYAERADGGVYRTTPAFRRLAAGADDRSLVRLADKPLRDLHRTTEETVNLGVLRHTRIVYLTVLESPQPLRRMVSPAMTDPFACTALGRAIVAHLPAARQAFLLKSVAIERRTPRTVVEPKELAAILADVRQTGVAVEEEETDLGVMCIGAPVFDRDGVAAAVSLTVPTVRATQVRRATLVELVRKAAVAVSSALKREGSA